MPSRAGTVVHPTPAKTSKAKPEQRKCIPKKMVEDSRQNEYQNLTPVPATRTAIAHAWVMLLASFFTMPQGVWCFLFMLSFCGIGVSPDFVRANPLLCIFVGGAFTGVWSVVTFTPLAMYHEKRYMDQPENRCQVASARRLKEMVAPLLSRSEVRLAMFNLVTAATLSAVMVVDHFTKGYCQVYTDASEYGMLWLALQFPLYFLWVDFWAYSCHRCLHFPWLYKRFHKVHHAWQQPTGFTALALHPVEFLLLEAGTFGALYFMPLHIGCVIVNVGYIHFLNVVDHSGVYSESALFWQPSVMFHDDHHRLFHLNYGQATTLWDRLGGTFYNRKTKYTKDNFSDFAGKSRSKK